MAAEYELTFRDYLSIMRGRAKYLIAIFVTVFLIAIVVAFTIPPAYRATGTIMVESQQVPDNIVPSTIRDQLDARINNIMQRVMTRESLLRLADKYNLFKENMVPLPTSELIDRIKDRINVETESTGEVIRTNQQGQQATAFTVSFEDRRPEVALNVTNDLIQLFLDWNIKLRTEGATETTVFLSEEADKLKAEVDRQEQLISEYKQRNKNALPEQLTLRMTMLSRAENDLREVERDYRSTKEDLRSLGVELAAAKQGLDETNPTAETLPSLKAEYARLSAIYTDSYPDVRILKRKIEELERTEVKPASGIAATNVSNLAVYRIQAKIDSDQARLKSLEDQRTMLQRTISENQDAMFQTPRVEQGLNVLIRDRDSAQHKYEEYLNKKMNAKIAQNLESENMSERFTVLEPPILPEKPYKPNRVKIILMGFILALVSSGSAVMTMESIQKRIRGSEALSHVLGNRPLVVIPYLVVQEEIESEKRIIKISIIATFVLLILTIVAIHYLYMPLNILFVKILAKLI